MKKETKEKIINYIVVIIGLILSGWLIGGIVWWIYHWGKEMIEIYILCCIAGLVLGIYIGKKLNSDLDVKTCVDYLTKQGFWVNLNTRAKQWNTLKMILEETCFFGLDF